MAALSDEALFRKIQQYWGDEGPDVVAKMFAIARAESGGDPSRTGDNFKVPGATRDPRARWDYGLMQVNSQHGYDPDRLVGDVDYNLQAAREIYDQQGITAWSTYPGVLKEIAMNAGPGAINFKKAAQYAAGVVAGAFAVKKWWDNRNKQEVTKPEVGAIVAERAPNQAATDERIPPGLETFVQGMEQQGFSYVGYQPGTGGQGTRPIFLTKTGQLVTFAVQANGDPRIVATTDLGLSGTDDWKFTVTPDGDVFRSNSSGEFEFVKNDPRLRGRPNAQVSVINGRLVAVDPQTLVRTDLGEAGFPDKDPSTIQYEDTTTGKGYTYNTRTGVRTEIGTVGHPALDPAERIVTDETTGETFAVNQTTGAKRSLGKFNYPAINPERTQQVSERGVANAEQQTRNNQAQGISGAFNTAYGNETSRLQVGEQSIGKAGDLTSGLMSSVARMGSDPGSAVEREYLTRAMLPAGTPQSIPISGMLQEIINELRNTTNLQTRSPYEGYEGLKTAPQAPMVMAPPIVAPPIVAPPVMAASAPISAGINPAAWGYTPQEISSNQSAIGGMSPSQALANATQVPEELRWGMAEGGITTEPIIETGDPQIPGVPNRELVITPPGTPKMVIPISDMMGAGTPSYGLGTLAGKAKSAMPDPQLLSQLIQGIMQMLDPSSGAAGEPVIQMMEKRGGPDVTLPRRNVGQIPQYAFGTDQQVHTMATPSPTLPSAGLSPTVAASQQGNITTTPDEAWQGLPLLSYLIGSMSKGGFGTLATGTQTGSFGTQVPLSGSLNVSKAQDVEEQGGTPLLSALYKAAGLDYKQELMRALQRAPIGRALSTTAIRS